MKGHPMRLYQWTTSSVSTKREFPRDHSTINYSCNSMNRRKMILQRSFKLGGNGTRKHIHGLMWLTSKWRHYCLRRQRNAWNLFIKIFLLQLVFYQPYLLTIPMSLSKFVMTCTFGLRSYVKTDQTSLSQSTWHPILSAWKLEASLEQERTLPFLLH